MIIQNMGLKRLVLLDIDGTLLRTSGLGMLSIKEAMLMVFGECGTIDTYIGGGKSYVQIVQETLASTTIKPETIRAAFPVFDAEVGYFLQRHAVAEPNKIYPLPGGREIVDRLSRHPDVCLGLVTGNPLNCSKIKLEAAGYGFDCFTCNAFGSDAGTRANQIQVARRIAYQNTGYNFAGKSTVMIGDMIYDVYSAREAGAKSIVVNTGDSTRSQLENTNPDYFFASLEECEEILEAIF